MADKFNIVAIVQDGRLAFEALLLAASIRRAMPGFNGRFFLAEPEQGGAWPTDPGIQNPELRAMLQSLGAEFLRFPCQHFGASYPHGNKIEALAALPEGEPFLFLDTDTLILRDLREVPFDFDKPTASLRRENTWPSVELYGPGYTETWKSLYDMFGLDFESSLDLSQPDEYWERYLYFNAGWFTGACPVAFGKKFLETALAIRDTPPPALVCQSLDPWLDQVALPLVIHAQGGGRDGKVHGMMDGSHHCHWRVLSLLFARESDEVVDVLREISAPNKLKKLLKEYDPFKRMIYQAKGEKARDLFNRADLPRHEETIRKRLKARNLWLR